jgi:hypothetical protein
MRLIVFYVKGHEWIFSIFNGIFGCSGDSTSFFISTTGSLEYKKHFTLKITAQYYIGFNNEQFE